MGVTLNAAVRVSQKHEGLALGLAEEEICLGESYARLVYLLSAKPVG